MASFSPEQSTFIATLASHVGLNPGVVAAWVAAEEPVGARSGYHGTQDWLNVGITDSGPRGAGNNVWNDPTQAAIATANWIKGTWSDPGFGSAAPGIRAIAGTAGKSAGAQISAIQNSGWASGGYSDLPQLYSMYGKFNPGGVAVAQQRAGGQPSVSTSFSGGQTDTEAAGLAALMSAADRPISTTGKVTSDDILGHLLSNIESGLYTTPSSANTTLNGNAQVAQSRAGMNSGGMSHIAPHGWSPNRLDMGMDGTFTNVLAAPVGNLIVTYASNSFSNWGGYIVLRTADGRNIPGLHTNSLYFAEGLAPTVHVGQRLNAGQVFARAVPSPFNGIAGNIEWGPAISGIMGQPTDPLAKQFGLGSAAARQMVLDFNAWAQHALGMKGATSTGNAGSA